MGQRLVPHGHVESFILFLLKKKTKKHNKIELQVPIYGTYSLSAILCKLLNIDT